MNIAYFIPVAILALFVQHAAQAWLTVESGDYRYHVYEGTRTWPGMNFCPTEFAGTQLPLPKSKGDDRRLYKLMTSVFGLAENSTPMMWIDAQLAQTTNDQAPDWVDHNGVALQYRGWAAGQPNGGVAESFIIVGVWNNDLGWHDAISTYSNGYVFCEKKIIQLIPVVCTLTACDGPILELPDCTEIEGLDDFMCPRLAPCENVKQHGCPRGWKVGSSVKCVGNSTDLDEV